MSHHPDTLTVHAGQEEADPATNARAVPIYQTTSYVFDDTEHAADLFALRVPGNIYTRIMNPTQSVFETRMTALEGGVGALATASGAAAITYAVLNLTYAGDNIVALSTLYGGTYALFAHTLPQFGIEVRFVDPDKPEELAQLVDDKTKLVFGETIGNPADQRDRPGRLVGRRARPRPAVHRRQHRDHARSWPGSSTTASTSPSTRRPSTSAATAPRSAASSSTPASSTGPPTPTASPASPQPDPAYHGVVWTEAAGPAAYIIRARTVLLRNTGAAISPFNAWLFLQGLETLHLRIERHSRQRPRRRAVPRGPRQVAWVNYPGLESSPVQGDRRPDPHRTRLRRHPRLRAEGRARGGLEVHRVARAVLPPGQHRRRQVAGDPQRHHHALPAHRGRTGGGRRGAGDGAAVAWASSTSTT